MGSILTNQQLAQIPIFTDVNLDPSLPSARLNTLIHQARGEILFHQGDPSNGFYYVESGRVQLTVMNRSGTVATVEVIGEGETFGEAMVFLGRPYPVSATALLDSTLYFVASPFIDTIIANDQRATRRLLTNLSVRNHQLVTHVATLGLENATQRVSSYLLAAAGQAASGEDTVEVKLADSKRIIANRLGLTPETFSRALRRLANDHLISVKGSHITLRPHLLSTHMEDR